MFDVLGVNRKTPGGKLYTHKCLMFLVWGRSRILLADLKAGGLVNV